MPTQNRRFFTLSRTVCTAVMTALAVFGRIAFAAIPNFKPTTAIVILAGAAFGRGGADGRACGAVVEFHLRTGNLDARANVGVGACRSAFGFVNKM